MLAYLLLRNNIQSGPYSLKELKVLGIRATDLLWVEGRSSAWRYPDEIEELQAFVDAAKANKEAIFVSDDNLHIHHEGDECNKMMQGNQSAPLSVSQTEGKPDELIKGKEGMIGEDMTDKLQIRETISKRTLEIRKNLLAKKEDGSSSSPIPENNKIGFAEDKSSLLRPIKVIIADDHTLFREGVKTALAQKKTLGL